MMSLAILWLFAAAVALIPTACLSKVTPYKLTTEEFNQRLRFVVPDPQKSIDQTKAITTFMSNGIAFVAAIPEFDSPAPYEPESYLTQPAKTVQDIEPWPLGSYSMARSCYDLSYQTLFNAMQACGPKETCATEFAMINIFGTLTGMNFGKDDVVVYNCFAAKTTNAKCKNPKQAPCRVEIIEDLHTKMWSHTSLPPLIGNGALSVAEIAGQIQAYNKQHGTKITLPSVRGA